MSIRPSGETADYRRGYEDGCKATRENIDEAAKLRALAKQASPTFRELTGDLAAAPPAEAPGERGDDLTDYLGAALALEARMGEQTSQTTERAMRHAATALRIAHAKRAAAPAAPAVGVGYFAADPAQGEFTRYNTLEEAVSGASKALEYADEDAAESGWADDPPQICYGVVLGGCVEQSREPAPEDSDFTEIVSYRLTAPRVTGGREALLREARELALSHLGLLTIHGMTDGVEQTRDLIARIDALQAATGGEG